MVGARPLVGVMHQADSFHNGLPVYKDAGRLLGPDEKNKWERAWENGFYTSSALYRLKGLKPSDDAVHKAYVANALGRLSGLYHVDDGVPVKRHRKTLKRLRRREALKRSANE